MSSLVPCGQTSRWLALLVGFATLAVTIVAVVPHDVGKIEDQDCLVCKAGQEPLTELAVELVFEPPVVHASKTPENGVAPTPLAFVESAGPRAPPV
jgi:hypothetical protein